MKINREGYTIIGFTMLLFVVTMLLAYYFVAQKQPCGWIWSATSILVILWLLIALFFREPRRKAERDENLIYAPCDGRVVVTEVVFEGEHIKEEMMHISIFMSVSNVHVNWLPIGGKVEYFKHHDGKFIVAWNPKSSELNERTSTVIRHHNGERFMIRQVAGYVARRIVSYMSEGVQVKQCDKMGFIKFGSRIDILMPKGVTPLVKIGDKTIGAESVIAKF